MPSSARRWPREWSAKIAAMVEAEVDRRMVEKFGADSGG